jgi:hypothetical protein
MTDITFTGLQGLPRDDSKANFRCSHDIYTFSHVLQHFIKLQDEVLAVVIMQSSVFLDITLYKKVRSCVYLIKYYTLKT